MTPDTLPLPRLRVVTREIDPVEDVLSYTPSYAPAFWSRRDASLAAFGSIHELRAAEGVDSPARFVAEKWRAIAAAAEIDDPVGLPGTGLIALGSFTFDPRSAKASTLTVPWIVVGRRGGRSWVTRISHADSVVDDELLGLPARVPYGPHWSATLGPGAMDPDAYQDAVRAALGAIERHEVDKVVLARDLVGTAPVGADLRRLVRSLASGYPDCWIFAVDGLIGASPETLVTVSAGTVTARVLAGTTARGADVDADAAASVALATSPKDQDEHRFAVQSVLASLRPHTSALAAAEQPFTLRLPNVWHLATDVEGVLSDAASSLDLLEALHPTAAVAGTPTRDAVELIRRLEPFDRGRYAGAVGWVDATGDGEWAIALRCAQFDIDAVPAGSRDAIALTAYAGAGIVAGSDPESELLETRVKFRPIVEALA
ncbi:isochorismate synthase [Microbacterium sp. AG1240]|uniref:isochorismate synthase n=1 Tax=Microbacterium sp. AG1240 TaxID=2183992 RepID=UPI000EAFCF12|nr:isochorismate synthase [Microbacterium sp. AG1240]RKT33266.1 isochorismate synthase [Microbacterium sp. AG1240]